MRPLTVIAVLLALLTGCKSETDKTTVNPAPQSIQDPVPDSPDPAAAKSYSPQPAEMAGPWEIVTKRGKIIKAE